MKRLPTSQLSRVVLLVCMLYMAMSTTRVLQVLPLDLWDNKELVFPSVVHLDGEGVYYGKSPDDDNDFRHFARKNVSRDYFGYDGDDRMSSRSKPRKKPACDSMTEWQDTFFPTCNVLHELELSNRVLMREPSDVGKILGVGGKRIAWKISTNNVQDMETVVLKTIRYEKNYTISLFENKRRDAVATERSTFSPHVMNIYGHCAGAVLNEIGERGADEFFVETQQQNMTTMEMLRYARDAARAVSDVHSVGVGNKTTLVHGDVRPWNFIMTEGGRRIRLHDFDQAHFLRWKRQTGEVCGFRNYACNRNRAPEECIRDTKQTEKIDVYGVGNMIFFIITKILPYKNLGRPKEENQEMVRQGITPQLPKEWDKSTDPAIKLLKKVMHECHTFDSEQRPSAVEMADALSRGYDSLLAAKQG